MDTKRQNKIAHLIQQDISDIFLKEMKTILGNSLITVTDVRITPDLSIARVYVSIFPIGNTQKEQIMNNIKENIPDIRRRLGTREAKQLRIIPQLEFYIDNSLDYAENIERLLKK